MCKITQETAAPNSLVVHSSDGMHLAFESKINIHTIFPQPTDFTLSPCYKVLIYTVPPTGSPAGLSIMHSVAITHLPIGKEFFILHTVILY